MTEPHCKMSSKGPPTLYLTPSYTLMYHISDHAPGRGGLATRANPTPEDYRELSDIIRIKHWYFHFHTAHKPYIGRHDWLWWIGSSRHLGIGLSYKQWAFPRGRIRQLFKLLMLLLLQVLLQWRVIPFPVRIRSGCSCAFSVRLPTAKCKRGDIAGNSATFRTPNTGKCWKSSWNTICG